MPLAAGAQVVNCLRYGVTPVFVLDGRTPDAKLGRLQQRCGPKRLFQEDKLTHCGALQHRGCAEQSTDPRRIACSRACLLLFWPSACSWVTMPHPYTAFCLNLQWACAI